ncbi:MAG TPA: hypothetical protein VF545_04540 [Thermoleophilaceae bacterium]
MPSISLLPVMASIDRAGDHLLVLAAVVGVVAVCGAVYGLVRLARRRGGRRSSGGDPESERRPEA